MLIAIHLLCAATAFAIAVLLLRAWHVSRSGMQLHTGVCFAILTVVNGIVAFDRWSGPPNDFSTLRLSLSVLAVGFLLYGIVVKEH